MAKSRMKTTVRDMVLSLAVISVPIAIVLAVEPSTPGAPVQAIASADFQSDLSAARAAEPFTVLVPTGLSAAWRATSESYQAPGSGAADWHVGYLTPSGHYADLDQTTQALGPFLSAENSDAGQDGAVQLDGIVWNTYGGTTPAAMPTLLVRTVGKNTLVVVGGNGPLRELEQFAESLQG